MLCTLREAGIAMGQLLGSIFRKQMQNINNDDGSEPKRLSRKYCDSSCQTF